MRNMTTHSEKPKNEEMNIFLLHIMFLVALLALSVLTPVYGFQFAANSVITSFAASCAFIYMT